MHLLVVAHDLYPDPGSGGTGRYVYETCRRLVHRGHEVTVLTRRRGQLADRQTVDGIRVLRYDLALEDEDAWAIARQLGPASRALRDRLDRLDEPDLVSFQATVGAPLVDRLVPDPIPRSTTFHSPWPVEYEIKASDGAGAGGLRTRWNVWLRRRLERRVLEASDLVITLSAYMAGKLRDVHGPIADPVIVPGGVDTQVYRPDVGIVDEVKQADPALLTVRRLSARMGHRSLLAAFARIRTRHPDARLFIAGDGPLRNELEAEAVRLGVDDRTRFLGYVEDEQLPALYASSDVFVLPTLRLEGFGLATLEALATGVPVVATPVGASPELLGPLEEDEHVPRRMLARAAAGDALAEAMDAWASLDGSQRARAGKACRRFVEARYTWEAVTDELERVYEEFLGDRQPSARSRARPPPAR